MANLISGALQYNLESNTFIWVCTADDGTTWIRTPDGKWGQANAANITDFGVVQTDYATYLAANQAAPAATLESSDTNANVSTSTP